MNIKQLCFLVLSIISLQCWDLSACSCCCGDGKDPRFVQLMLAGWSSLDFYNNCERDPSLSGRMTISGFEIYDTKTNRTLAAFPDSDNPRRLYGMTINASRKILVTFLVPDVTDVNSEKCSKGSESDDKFFCSHCTVKVWNTANGTCLFTIPDVWLGKFNHKGDKIVTFGSHGVQVWDVNARKCMFTIPHEEGLREYSVSGDKIVLKYYNNGVVGVKVRDVRSGKLIK